MDHRRFVSAGDDFEAKGKLLSRLNMSRSVMEWTPADVHGISKEKKPVGRQSLEIVAFCSRVLFLSSPALAQEQLSEAEEAYAHEF